MGSVVNSDADGGNVQNITTVSFTGLGHQAGDIAIVTWAHSSLSAVSADPTTDGFTLIGNVEDGNLDHDLFYKVLTGSESGAVTLNMSAIARQSAVMTIVRGYSGIDAWSSVADTGTDGVHTAPAVTPAAAANGGVIVATAERQSSGSTSCSPAAGYTVASQFGTGGTNGCFTAQCYEGSSGTIGGTHSVGVAINPGDFTHNASAANATVFTIYLTPNGTGATVNAVTATASGLVLPPSVAASSTVAAVKASATGLAPTPVVRASVTITAVKATATGTAPAPTPAAGSAITAVAATATGAAQAPAIRSDATINAVTATASAQAYVPVVGAVTIVHAVTATATADALEPIVTAGANVLAVLAEATAQALAPVISGFATMSAPVATASGQAYAPSVTGGSPAAGTTFVRVWDGTSLLVRPIRVWNGTAWEPPV